MYRERGGDGEGSVPYLGAEDNGGEDPTRASAPILTPTLNPMATSIWIADAEENLGESEVREAHLAKSLFYIRIGGKEKALEQLKITDAKTVAVGQKMDLVFYTLQLGFIYMDFDLISKSIDKAKKLFEEGGDWERKNCFKAYEGLYFMSTRNFKQATDPFLDSISTFTTYELFPYGKFILYAVLTRIISLDRVSLKQKIYKQNGKTYGFDYLEDEILKRYIRDYEQLGVDLTLEKYIIFPKC